MQYWEYITAQIGFFLTGTNFRIMIFLNEKEWIRMDEIMELLGELTEEEKEAFISYLRVLQENEGNPSPVCGFHQTEKKEVG